MSQAASSQVTQEMNDLKEEILFQKVLLSSIDDHVQNREAAEQEVRDEIHSLERKLNQLKRASRGSSKPSSQNLQSTPEQPASSVPEDPATVAMNGYPGELVYAWLCHVTSYLRRMLPHLPLLDSLTSPRFPRAWSY